MLRYNLREVDERKKIDDVLNVGTANRVIDYERTIYDFVNNY
jgi:hypothetical protein